MSKYFKRVESEFEQILLELSKMPSTTHNDACIALEKYLDKFSSKVTVTKDELKQIKQFCKEMAADWYPDVESELFSKIII